MMYQLDEVQFENDIISLLKNNVIKNVVGSYPNGTVNFPLIVTSLTTSPSQYDISKNIIRSRVSLTVSVWDATKTSLVKTKQKIEQTLLGYGFTRLNPSNIIIDNTNEKYYFNEQFVINYDNMSNKFERSI